MERVMDVTVTYIPRTRSHCGISRSRVAHTLAKWLPEGVCAAWSELVQGKMQLTPSMIAPNVSRCEMYAPGTFSLVVAVRPRPEYPPTMLEELQPQLATALAMRVAPAVYQLSTVYPKAEFDYLQVLAWFPHAHGYLLDTRQTSTADNGVVGYAIRRSYGEPNLASHIVAVTQPSA
jgi:hypothetical protein